MFNYLRFSFPSFFFLGRYRFILNLTFLFECVFSLYLFNRPTDRRTDWLKGKNIKLKDSIAKQHGPRIEFTQCFFDIIYQNNMFTHIPFKQLDH